MDVGNSCCWLFWLCWRIMTIYFYFLLLSWPFRADSTVSLFSIRFCFVILWIWQSVKLLLVFSLVFCYCVFANLITSGNNSICVYKRTVCIHSWLKAGVGIYESGESIMKMRHPSHIFFPDVLPGSTQVGTNVSSILACDPMILRFASWAQTRDKVNVLTTVQWRHSTTTKK